MTYRTSPIRIGLAAVAIAAIPSAPEAPAASGDIPAAAYEASDPDRTAAEPSPWLSVHGNAAQRELVDWAAGRYTDAGLRLPSMEIWFHSNSAPCRGFSGLALTGGERPIVRVCKQSQAQRVLLHEIAHIWTSTHIDDKTRQQFIELRGARSWNTEGDWAEQANEQASEIIMWALADSQIVLMESIGDRDHDSLAEGYELLTGLELPEWRS